MSNLARRLRRKGGGYRTIEFVGAKTLNLQGSTSSRSVSITSLTGGLASAPAIGDLVIIIYATANGGDMNVDMSVTDYTELCDLYSNDTNDAQLGIYWRVMPTPTETTCTISSSGHNDNAVVIGVSVWRNVDPTTPFDVTTTTATGTNTGLPDPPTITPTTPGAVIVAAGSNAMKFVLGSDIFSSPDLTDFRSLEEVGDTNDLVMGFGYKVWTSGAFDAGAFTYSGSDNVQWSWCAATVAMRPALS